MSYHYNTNGLGKTLIYNGLKQMGSISLQWGTNSGACLRIPELWFHWGVSSHISLPIAIGKFFSAIGKLMIGKTLATNVKEITNAMIGNDVLAIYW